MKYPRSSAFPSLKFPSYWLPSGHIFLPLPLRTSVPFRKYPVHRDSSLSSYTFSLNSWSISSSNWKLSLITWNSWIRPSLYIFVTSWSTRLLLYPLIIDWANLTIIGLLLSCYYWAAFIWLKEFYFSWMWCGILFCRREDAAPERLDLGTWPLKYSFWSVIFCIKVLFTISLC